MLQHPAELQRRATWGGQRSKQTKYQYWNSHMHTKKPKQTCGELNGLCLTCFVTAAVQCVWFAPPCSPCAHQASCTSSTAHVQRGFTSKRCASLNILLPTWKIAAKESMIRIHHILCVKLREARRYNNKIKITEDRLKCTEEKWPWPCLNWAQTDPTHRNTEDQFKELWVLLQETNTWKN